MKILIGGVPYGRDNVGDEAIIATIVQSVRKAAPTAEITVSTDEPEHTAEKLKVRTVPLLGFLDPPYSKEQLETEMENADVYIWGGATGLSDYPETALGIADCALKHNTKLVLYSVGMNNKLNPAFYKIGDSPKKRVFDLIKKLSFNIIDVVGNIENKKLKATYTHIKETLNQASLIIVRDEPSKKQLKECGVSKEIYDTTDSAILLPLVKPKRVNEIWKNNNIWNNDVPIIGVCISAQRAVKQTDAIASLLDFLIEKKSVHILFIPMNDKTDYYLLEDLGKNMKNSDKTRILKGRFEPEEIAAVAAKTSLIISSRLHLIILAAITKIPVTGLSRGTKIDKYLKIFGEKTPGSVEDFKLEEMKKICIRLLDNKEEFQGKADKIVPVLKKKAEKNIKLLKDKVFN